MGHHSHLYIHIGAGSESFVLHLSARANGMRAAYNFRYLLDCGLSCYHPCSHSVPTLLVATQLDLHDITASRRHASEYEHRAFLESLLTKLPSRDTTAPEG